MTATGRFPLTARLAAIVGTDYMQRSPELDPVDAAGRRAALAVAPGSLEEAAAVLAAARAAGAAVAIAGGGTQQHIGAPPARLDLVLQTSRLRDIVEWEPADLTASLQAGTPLAAVQAMLAERGQQLPIDAPAANRATIGGLVATNTSGPRRWGFGGWRDLIIGMNMALADGSTIKSGGRVVKNVQGYDLGKLFTGALGTLGLIGQVNVKLAPLPPARRLLVGRGDLAAVAAFLDAVAASAARVIAVDLLDGSAAIACGLGGGSCAGLVLCEGQQAVVDGQAHTVAQLAAEAGVSGDVVEGEALSRVWGAWVDLASTDDLGAGGVLLTISTTPAQVVEALAAIGRAAEEHELACWRWARAGNGVVYAKLGKEAGKAPAALAAAQAALLARWPATTLTAGSAAVAAAAQPWGTVPAGIASMRALKERFDPAGVLQPGRYVGGI